MFHLAFATMDHGPCGGGENVINDVIIFPHTKLTMTHLQDWTSNPFQLF